MKDILKRNHVENTCDLEAAMKKRTDDLSLREERIAQKIPGDNNIIAAPYLTIVASDITTQTKVEFPLMAKDYWPDTDVVSPADFVRASMAIPVFFEPFKVTVEQSVQDRSRLQQLKAAAADRANTDSKVISFVDGGILSNFPINVFHNPNIKVARMPTFGVKLEDEKHIIPGQENKEKPTLLRFIGNVFSTIRFYYDRDFLKRNEIYEKSIAHVDVAGFNWLNFGMGYEDQKKLFIKGADGVAGVVMFNPEYGERLGDEADLEATYARIGDFLKKKCKGYTGYIFTGNLDLAKKIGLKAARRIEFYTGKIDCRLLEYELYAGSKR